jgi:hypothetical protein
MTIKAEEENRMATPQSPGLCVLCTVPSPGVSRCPLYVSSILSLLLSPCHLASPDSVLTQFTARIRVLCGPCFLWLLFREDILQLFS